MILRSKHNNRGARALRSQRFNAMLGDGWLHLSLPTESVLLVSSTVQTPGGRPIYSGR